MALLDFLEHLPEKLPSLDPLYDFRSCRRDHGAKRSIVE